MALNTQQMELKACIQKQIDEVRAKLTKNQDNQRLLREAINTIHTARTMRPLIWVEHKPRTIWFDYDTEYFEKGARIPCSECATFHEAPAEWTKEEDEILIGAVKSEIVKNKLNDEESEENPLDLLDKVQTETKLGKHMTRKLIGDASEGGVWAKIGRAFGRNRIDVRNRYILLSRNFIPRKEINKKKLFRKLKKKVPKSVQEWKKLAQELSTKNKPVNPYDIISLHILSKNQTMVGFTKRKDAILRRLVSKHGTDNWGFVCQEFNQAVRKDRSIRKDEKTFAYPAQLNVRWEQKLDKKGGNWTDEESLRLMFAKTIYEDCTNLQGQFEWKNVGRHVEGRGPAKCRERYTKVLFDDNKFKKVGEDIVEGKVVKQLTKPKRRKTKKKTKKSSLKKKNKNRKSSATKCVMKKKKKGKKSSKKRKRSRKRN